MYFYHDKCNREVFLDFSDNFLLRTPSIEILGGKASATMLEMHSAKSRNSPGKFYCTSCSETVKNEHIVGNCEICQNLVTLDSLVNCSQFSSICRICYDYLAGDKDASESPSKLLLNASRWISLTEESEIIPLSDIVKNVRFEPF